MAERDEKTAKENKLPQDPEVTELDDASLEDVSGGATRSDIVINNCNC